MNDNLFDSDAEVPFSPPQHTPVEQRFGGRLPTFEASEDDDEAVPVHQHTGAVAVFPSAREDQARREKAERKRALAREVKRKERARLSAASAGAGNEGDGLLESVDDPVNDPVSEQPARRRKASASSSSSSRRPRKQRSSSRSSRRDSDANDSSLSSSAAAPGGDAGRARTSSSSSSSSSSSASSSSSSSSRAELLDGDIDLFPGEDEDDDPRESSSSLMRTGGSGKATRVRSSSRSGGSGGSKKAKRRTKRSKSSAGKAERPQQQQHAQQQQQQQDDDDGQQQSARTGGDLYAQPFADVYHHGQQRQRLRPADEKHADDSYLFEDERGLDRVTALEDYQVQTAEQRGSAWLVILTYAIFWFEISLTFPMLYRFVHSTDRAAAGGTGGKSSDVHHPYFIFAAMFAVFFLGRRLAAPFWYHLSHVRPVREYLFLSTFLLLAGDVAWLYFHRVAGGETLPIHWLVARFAAGLGSGSALVAASSAERLSVPGEQSTDRANALTAVWAVVVPCGAAIGALGFLIRETDGYELFWGPHLRVSSLNFPLALASLALALLLLTQLVHFIMERNDCCCYRPKEEDVLAHVTPLTSIRYIQGNVFRVQSSGPGLWSGAGSRSGEGLTRVDRRNLRLLLVLYLFVWTEAWTLFISYFPLARELRQNEWPGWSWKTDYFFCSLLAGSCCLAWLLRVVSRRCLNLTKLLSLSLVFQLLSSLVLFSFFTSHVREWHLFVSGSLLAMSLYFFTHAHTALTIASAQLWPHSLGMRMKNPRFWWLLLPHLTGPFIGSTVLHFSDLRILRLGLDACALVALLLVLLVPYTLVGSSSARVAASALSRENSFLSDSLLVRSSGSAGGGGGGGNASARESGRLMGPGQQEEDIVSAFLAASGPTSSSSGSSGAHARRPRQQQQQQRQQRQQSHEAALRNEFFF